MTRSEFETRRDEINSRMDDIRDRHTLQEEKYNAKMENGNVSKIGKFIHGLCGILFAFTEDANKRINKM